jgi:hypothetical protein
MQREFLLLREAPQPFQYDNKVASTSFSVDILSNKRDHQMPKHYQLLDDCRTRGVVGEAKGKKR